MKKFDKDTKRVHFIIESDIYKELEDIAKERMLSVSDIIRLAVSIYLTKHSKS